MSLEWDLSGKGVVQENQALGGPQLKQKRLPVIHHPEGPACTLQLRLFFPLGSFSVGQFKSQFTYCFYTS